MKILTRFVLASTVILASCVEVIDLDLDDSDPKIVIDGKINNLSLVEVKITTSIPVKEKNEFPPVLDAIVKITDRTADVTVELIQHYPGVYSTEELEGIPGHTYELSVSVGDHGYMAESTMPYPVAIEALTFEEAQRFQSEKSYRLIASYNDPDTLGNNYRYVMYQNGIQSQSIFIRNDAFTNGNHVDQAIFNPDIKIVKGDLMEVELQCVDKAVFEYFNGLMLLNSDRGISPTNPSTNINGNALGYFSAFTSSRRSVIIQ